MRPLLAGGGGGGGGPGRGGREDGALALDGGGVVLCLPSNADSRHGAAAAAPQRRQRWCLKAWVGAPVPPRAQSVARALLLTPQPSPPTPTLRHTQDHKQWAASAPRSVTHRWRTRAPHDAAR